MFSRKALGFSIGWTVEISGHLIYFIAFFGATWILKHKHHVKIDAVLVLIGTRKRALLEIFTSGVSAVLCFFIAYRSVLVTIDLWHRQIRTDSSLEIIMWPLMIVIFIGTFFLSLQFIRDTHNHIMKRKTGIEESTDEMGLQVL